MRVFLQKCYERLYKKVLAKFAKNKISEPLIYKISKIRYSEPIQSKQKILI